MFEVFRLFTLGMASFMAFERCESLKTTFFDDQNEMQAKSSEKEPEKIKKNKKRAKRNQTGKRQLLDTPGALWEPPGGTFGHPGATKMDPKIALGARVDFGSENGPILGQF